MIQAYVLIEAEPIRVQDLMKELPGTALQGSLLKQIHAATAPFDLIAYLQGFRCALKDNVDAICQMDADLSHDPATLVTMTKCLETCDVVFGSRYTPGGSVDMQWPIWRKGLSAWGNFYARMILRVPVRDITTGFRLWRSETLRGIPFDGIKSKGYIFQVEMAYLAHCLEYRILETPFHFADRCRGKSKMSLQIQMEAAFRVWQIWLTHRHLCHIGSAARIQQSQAVT